MIVTQEEFLASLARVEASASSDPRVGVFGPGSASWRIGRESALFLAGGRAALLQLAHPYVAHGVDHHSQTRVDPAGRFQRTFLYVFRMIFGDRNRALSAARRVYAVHRRIQGAIPEATGPFAAGHRYSANEVDALVWVLATLTDSAMLAHDTFVGRLSEADRDAYVRDASRFGLLFGIPESALPTDHAGFVAQWDDMMGSGVIRVTPPARDLARFLFSPPGMLRRLPFRWIETMTAGLLPERLRDEYELEFGRGRRFVFASSVRTIRGVYPLLPDRLRFTPAYQKAMRRIEGRPPDRFTTLLERAGARALAAPRRPG